MPDPSAVAFPILGRPFAARSASPRLAQWLRALWDYPETMRAPHAFAIALDTVASAPADLPGAWTVRDIAIPGLTLRFRTVGHTWETGDVRAGLRLDLDRHAARIQLWGDEAGGEATLYHGLYVVMSEALRASGLVPLHAAVARRDDVTVAWLGASGIGKSTTLLHAVEAGWSPIAEDLCWLEPETLSVHGWDRGVRCWPETLDRFFPQLKGAEAAADGKRLVRYERLGGDAGRPRTGTLTRLAVLGRDDAGPSRWERVGAREVVKVLWEATGVPLNDWTRELNAATVAQLSRLPVARLVLGNTPPPVGAAGTPPAQAFGG
jgi:hypothetical protein